MSLVSREVLVTTFIGALALLSTATYFVFGPDDPSAWHIDVSNWTVERTHQTTAKPPSPVASNPH